MFVKSIFPVLVVLSVVGVVRSGIFGCWMTEFECENENCIPMSKKCDGNDDCGDGSDEKGCDTTTASPPTRPPIPTATGSTRTTRGIPMGNLTSVKALLGSTTRMITTTPNSALVIRCRDLACGRDMLNWYKPDGELPEGSYVFDGQLVIPKVDCEETGPYICYCSGEGIRGYDVVELEVDRTLCTPSTRINFWDTVSTSPNTERQPWMTQPQNGYLSWWECKNGTGCYQFCCNKTCVNVLTVPSNTYRCKEGSYVPQSSVCNKIIDCPDGSDEIDCEVTCSQNEFQCGDGTCIPEIQKCDGEVDCLDGTDESSCMGLLRPMLTLLPGPGMEIDCADPDMQVKGGHVLQLECDFFGRPIPEVKWKKNEGHVPSKCISNSKFGHGILVCPNFQQSDQGAYSCVGENSLGTAESQPKTIVKCKEITCENGFRVRDEHNVETCLKCFCSGRSQSCHSLASKLVINSFNFPRTEVVMLASNTGEIFKPNSSNVNSNNLKPIKYCLMPEEEVQKHGFLMSYGRNLNLPAVDKKAAFLPNAPDVVMIGGGVMLTYSLNRIAHNSTRINVRFWNDNWLHADTRHASRIDIMDVLAHLQQLYIRCEYKEGVVKHDPFAKITLESAVLSDDSDAVSYVEKCSCPVGYDGLSCELCAPGYKRDADRDECIFQPIYPPKPCPIGSMGDHCDICDEANLYYKSTKTKTCVKTTCNAMGSLGLFPDDHDECLCKEKVIGKNCDMCEEGYFYLDKGNSYGCKKCWCSDATLDCKSSDYRRTTISSTISAWGGFNESNGGNFWLLPSEFSGNLLTSYGGFLRYTMKYKANVEKQPKALSVEILGATGVTIRHVNANRDINLADTEKTLSVPLEEPFWKDNSNAIVTRERLLSMLSQVKAIYVESPYHLSSGKVWITAVELDSAEDASNDIFEPSEGEKALKVEICECPVGYTGTSCESCSPGYYRQRNGLSSYVCAKCECELQYCDPLKGCAVCPKGKYNNNTNPGVSPVCLDCPCHGNEESCIKDDYNLIMCFCKPGYHGARCEIGDIVQGNFIVSISPILVLNKRAGTFVSFNCSYISDEEHRIEFEKKYAGNPPAHAGLFKVENYGWYGTLETNIETNLESVDCIVRNFGGRVIAWVSARVIGTVTDVSQPNITNCYDEPKYATENEDVYLRCDATGSPEPEITWHRVDKMGNLVVVDTTDGIHTIPSVNLGFNGTKFMCLAKNSHGDAKCMTRLIVRKRCVLSIQPFNPEVMEGDPIEFTCSTASGSTIVWSRTDDPLPKEAIITGGSLYIRSVQMSDMGEYKCTANDPYGPSVKTTRLTVKTRRTPPTAEILERDMQISEGSSVAVECSVTGSPWPKITWAKLEDVFPSNVRVSGDGVTLHITNANVKNTGMYQCRAESFLNATSRILISVVEKPEIIVVPDEINAKLGETVQVECIPVKGEPFTSLEWMHHNNWMDSDISTGNKLRFESIESHDSGVYTCRARNVAGEVEERVTINVGTPPVVTLKPSHTIHAVPKDQVDVRCLVEGNPRPEIKWYVSTLPRLKINPGGNRFPKLVEMFEERGENLKVTVTEDLESVVCEATNIIGVASATVKFDVKAGKPENRGLSKQVRIGTRVELDFSMLGMPINCTRQKGPMIGDECYTPNGLEIMNAQVQHTGTYKCTSKTDEMSYTLKVDGFVHKFTKREMSYLILPMTVKSATEFQVEITFKPERQSGFLLMKKKHHAFAMYLKRGKLTVKLRRHSEEVVITTEQNLQLGVWHTAVFKLRNNAELAMYDEEGVEREIVVEGKKFEMNWLANVEDSLYVGGVKVSERHLPLSPVDAHFEGCISRVIVDGHEYKMTEEGKISQNVSLCNICSSGVNPCGGDSVCYDAPTHYGFVCVCGGDVCRKNCMGRPCQTSLNMCQLVKPCGHSDNKCFPSGNGYRCQCAEGYSGIDCSREEAYEFSLNGDGYLKLPEVYLPRNSLKEPEVISIAFTPAHDLKLRRATLFSQGNDRDYLEIYMEDDSIVYVYNNQRNKLQLTGPTDLSNEYRVVVTRRNNTAIMMINEEEYSDEVPFSTNRVYGDIYIGGSPKKNNCERTFPFYRNCEESTQSAFKGCIHEITINGKRINTLAKDIVRRNIQRKCKTDKYMETADYSASINDDSESSNDDIF